jgi:hypothetical protein
MLIDVSLARLEIWVSADFIINHSSKESALYALRSQE